MSSNKYYIRLDILRIISCVMVLLYHLDIIKGGFLAVCTFFVLSGYLGCVSLLKENEISFKKYYLNRIKRVYIPLLMVVSLTVIFAKIFNITNWLNLKQETISSVFGYNNFWQLSVNFDYFSKNVHTPFIHLWFISILMQFDLIFPFLFLFIKKLDQKIEYSFSALFILVLSVISTIAFYGMSKSLDIMIVYYNTFARCFSILWGVFFALVHQKFLFKFTQGLRKYDRIIFIIYSLILIILCLIISDSSNNYAIWLILSTFISVRLIKYATVKEDINGKDNKIISFFTNISYEIYLVQYPIIFFMQEVDIYNYIKIPIIIFLTIVVSYVLHFLFNYKSRKKLFNSIIIILFSLIVIIASYFVITEKDHTDEMAELQSRLNENTKIAEQKNKEFLNKDIKDETEWKIIKNDKDTENNNQIEEKNTDEENKVVVNKNKEEKENSTEVKKTIEAKEDNKEKQANANKVVAEKLKKMPIVGIGDSVFLDAVDLLYKKFPNGYFDGKISRSLIGGKEIILNLKNKGKLSNTVILALCTNGDYSEKRNKDIMQILGNRQIFWINAVGADDPKFNERFKKFAANYPNIHIVDWEAAAKNHPEYFYPDGIHAKGNGIKVYVETIYETIYKYYLEEYNKK